jgi:hypothetical protein
MDGVGLSQCHFQTNLDGAGLTECHFHDAPRGRLRNVPRSCCSRTMALYAKIVRFWLSFLDRVAQHGEKKAHWYTTNVAHF